MKEFYSKVFPFWETLSQADKDLLLQQSSKTKYSKGKNIHNGENCTGVIFVETGCLRLYLMSDEGKEITLYRLYPGDMCMLSASCVIEAITFDVFVDAEEDSSCCIINGSAFSQVSDTNPDVKIFALETAVSRFSDVMWVMQQVLFMSMDKRLAIFLLDESARLKSHTLLLTHEQIARYIGSAREVVSRMLKYFATEGYLQASRKDITILNKQALRKIAGLI